MFGPMLDVAIGLVLIFALFAGLLSVITESVATILKLRSKALENGLINMLEDPITRIDTSRLGVIDKVFGLFSAHKTALSVLRAQDSTASVSFFDAVYNHPLVGGVSLKNRPSYVPSPNLASALIYVLSGVSSGGSLGSRIQQGIAALPPGLGTLKTALTTIAQEAGGDVSAFKTGVEAWYDSAMDRLSGSYKRYSQACTFALGLVVAVACNVDAIKVVERLYTEPGLREQLVHQASADLPVHPQAKTSQDASNTLPDQLKAIGAAQKVLLASAAPLGWSDLNAPHDLGEAPLAIAGWFATALAGMMGAGFWFGMLQKLVDLRGAGPKPASGARKVQAKHG